MPQNLLPYTTDQLFNGWLYCDFDKICAQGNAEYMFAKILHRQKEDRVQIFGSLNFFAMREAIQKRKVVPVLHGNKKVNILFAGSTSKYYPTESEFKCLDFASY